MSTQLPEPPREPEVRREEGTRGRGPERALLGVIAAAVIICAGALVLTAWASMRAANAQRDMACFTKASSAFYDVNFDLGADPDLDDLEQQADQLSRQQEQVRTNLRDCGVELPADE